MSMLADYHLDVVFFIWMRDLDLQLIGPWEIWIRF